MFYVILRKCVVINYDNILIYFEYSKEYVDHVKKIMLALRKAQSFIDSKRCAFYLDKINFIEFVIYVK